jgi:hypothetical protein
MSSACRWTKKAERSRPSPHERLGATPASPRKGRRVRGQGSHRDHTRLQGARRRAYAPADTLPRRAEGLEEAKPPQRPLLRETYGADQETKWWAYWRIFFLACAELWAWRGGEEWLVTHLLFGKATPSP